MRKNWLVVVDYIEDFVDGALGSEEARAIAPFINEKIRVAKENEDAIIFLIDTHPRNYLDSAEGKKLPVIHGTTVEGRSISKLITEDATGIYVGDSYNVINALAHDERVIYVNKATFGSDVLFKGIRDGVYADAIESIELVGVCTDICVIANALGVQTAIRTVDPFTTIPVRVFLEGCAGVTPEAHEAAAMVMENCQIEVIR